MDINSLKLFILLAAFISVLIFVGTYTYEDCPDTKVIILMIKPDTTYAIDTKMSIKELNAFFKNQISVGFNPIEKK